MSFSRVMKSKMRNTRPNSTPHPRADPFRRTRATAIAEEPEGEDTQHFDRRLLDELHVDLQERTAASISKIETRIKRLEKRVQQLEHNSADHQTSIKAFASVLSIFPLLLSVKIVFWILTLFVGVAGLLKMLGF